MATTVDTLVVRIEADMKDMRRALRRVEGDVSRSTKKMSGAFGKLGQAMKVAVAAVIVRQGFIAGKAMINLASDIEEMQGKSSVVFGQFRDGVVKELTAFGDAVGRSSHELEGMASTVQDTFVPMGFARGEAAKLSVELTKLAVDTASFNNANDTDTIKAFQSALVGNHETVRRFGVVITQATLDQELFAMGIEGGNKAATNAQKVQARLNLITRGVADAHGDAERTSGSYANSMRGLRAEFSELAGELGTLFLPAITKVINALKEATIQTKEFFQDIGVFQTPIDRALVKTRAEITTTTNMLDNFRVMLKPTAEEIAAFGAYQPTDTSALEQRNEQAVNRLKKLLIDEKNIMADLQLIAKSQDFQTGKKEEKKEDKEDDDKTKARKEQLAQVTALLKETNKLAKLESDLFIAQSSNQPNRETALLTEIHMMKLKNQFTELETEDLKALADAQWMAKYASEEFSDHLSKQRKGKEEDIKLAEQGLALVKNETDATILLREQTEQLEAAKLLGKITQEQFNETLARLTEIIPPINEKFEQMKDRVQTTFDSMSDSLTEMVMNGKINFQTMGDMFKDMVKQMIADALKAQVIKPLLGGLFGGIGNAFGGKDTNIGAAFLSVASGAKQKASGGTIQGGNPYLVGERGPELIVPSSAGTIMNNHNTKNAMGRGGGTVVNQTINVQSGVAQTVRAEMISLLPRFKQDTMNAVVDAKRRGGAFGQAFG